MTDIGLSPESPAAGSAGLPSVSSAATVPRATPEAQTEASHDLGLRPSGIVPPAEIGWPFLLNQQRYLLESTRFADQKAAFAFAFSLGSLAFLYQQRLFDGLSSSPLEWMRLHPFPALAGIGLLASCALLMAAVLPRLWWTSDHELSLVFWDDVIQLQTPDRYLESIRRAGVDALHKELADHCFTLAKICSRKFTFVKGGMWAGAVGALLGLLCLP